MQAEVILLTNGPGELSSWVKPVVRQLRAEFPTARITIALVPCPYASGEEKRTIDNWNLPIRVWEPKETVSFLLLGKAPRRDTFRDFGVVLFLGGDQAFGVMMSQRTGYPLLTYTETEGRWAPWVDRFLAADRRTFLGLRNRRIHPRKIALVGNLMVDAVRPQHDPNDIRAKLGLSPDLPVVGLLPGSKPFKVKYITPLLLQAAENLFLEDPSIQFVLHQSPFTPLAQIEQALEDPQLQAVTGGCGGRLVTIRDRLYIFTPQGASIRILGPEHHYPGMAVADLALTVPGTNTAELAILGVPMIVLLPLNKPEEIPLDGLLGHLGAIPLIGKPLKRAAVRMVAHHHRLIALPNQRAGRAVTPELRGDVSPTMVSELARALLANDEKRRSIRMELHQVMGYPGAASAIVALLREAVANSARHAPRHLFAAEQEHEESN